MTATGTGAGELRERLAKALHRCFCERHRIPVDGYGDDGSMILEENGWFDQADAAIAIIAEAGLVLAPAGGTVTAEQMTDAECWAISRAAHEACLLRWVNPKADTAKIVDAMTAQGLVVSRAIVERGDGATTNG